MILNLLSWLIFGLIAGAIARLLLPGRDSMGFLGTIAIGVVGAMLGGFLGSLIAGRPQDEFAPAGFIGAIIGGILVLFLLRMFRSRRYT